MMIRPRWLPIYGPIVTQLAGSDVPLALLLGHIQVESAGRTDTRTRLDERGIMQIHPATSREMGFDHSKMFDASYSIWAGVEMFRRTADRVQRQYANLFPRGRDEFFWRIVRFDFAIGSGALAQIAGDMRCASFAPASWSEFVGYLGRNRTVLLRLTKHDPVKWASNVDRVFEIGEQLARTGAYVAASAGIGLVLIGATIAIILWKRRSESSVVIEAAQHQST
jgi:hypothetical protein